MVHKEREERAVVSRNSGLAVGFPRFGTLGQHFDMLRSLAAADAPTQAYATTRQEAIADRVPLAAALWIVFIGLACLFDFFTYPERRTTLGAVYGVEVAICIALVLVVRRRRDLGFILSVATAAMLELCISSYFALVAGNSEMLAIGLILVLASLQVIFPWGLIGQIVCSLAAIIGLLLAVASGAKGTLPWLYELFTVFSGAVLTSLGAHLLEQHRFDAFRRTADLQSANTVQREEAEISAALLRISAALNSSLSEPAEMVEQLSRTACEVLGVDWSATYLWDTGRQVYRLAGSAGPAAAALIDEVRSVEFSADSIPFVAAIQRDGLVEVPSPDHGSLFPMGLMDRWQASSLLAAAIRRRNEPIGFITVGYKDRRGPFAPVQIRLLSGIAQQAAVALDNARLMETARQANRIKSEFVSAMSHELRTPLNVILGYLDLLGDGSFGAVEADQADILARVRQRALQLLDLITATLDLNRLEGGRIPLVIDHFTVAELLAAVADNVPPNWRKEGVQLRWVTSCGQVLMRSDRAKAETALRNLVHNALKYTDRGEVTVEARLTADGRGVQLQVADTGIGISAKELPHIFEMFRQAHGVSSRGGGVGLGLYIVKRLAEALGGTVSVESTPGAGSRFTLQLPVEAQVAAAY